MGSDVPPPQYNVKAKATEFFSNKYFYHSKEVIAVEQADVRQVKLGNKTVEEVLQEINSRNEISTYFQGVILSGFDTLQSYWDESHATLESRLDGNVLSLWYESIEEINLVKKRFVDLQDWSYMQTKGDDDRQSDICVVLGPSGSGKTFCAVGAAAKYKPKKVVKHLMVIYLQASRFLECFTKDLDLLVQEIRKRCFDHVQLKEDVVNYRKLDMHISVVIDEAGNDETRYFETFSHLDAIYGVLDDKVSESVRLIVTGTGLTSEHLNSQSEVKKYRMIAWSEECIKAVATKRFCTLPGYVIDYVYTRPLLHALTTNARAAWFLLEMLTNFAQSRKYPKENKENETENLNDYKNELHNFTDLIEFTAITQVAAKYIDGNALTNLRSDESRRVAAMVFSEVNKSTRTTDPTLPNFTSYKPGVKELKIAKALIDVNVEYVNKTLVFVDKDMKSVLVSPAITLVLFILLGVEPRIMSSWKGQEVMTALHAFQKLAVEALCSDVKTSSRTLERIKLRMLAARILEQRDSFNVKIPRLGCDTVWLTGDEDSFADVVAPYSLFQCTHTQQENSKIECSIFDELSKCGLLKNDLSDRGKVGWVILNRLIKNWQTETVSDKSTIAIIDSKKHGHDRHRQGWMLYPVDQLKNEGVSIDVGVKFDPLNVQSEFSSDLLSDLGCGINFVVCTNADEIILNYFKSTQESVTKHDVGNVKTLKRTWKGEDDFENWEFSVTRSKVDEDGKLINEHQNLEPVVKRMRNNVNLSFYFG